MKQSVMSDTAIFGLMARTWIFTGDCRARNASMLACVAGALRPPMRGSQ